MSVRSVRSGPALRCGRLYVGLIYVAKLDEAAMADFDQKHVDPATKGGKNGATTGHCRPPVRTACSSAHRIWEGASVHERFIAIACSHFPTPTGGAHFFFLDAFLRRNGGGGGFVVGSKLSIADIQLFDLLDIFLREPLFPKQLRQRALIRPHPVSVRLLY